jgi:hypothetical protein
MSLSVKKDLHAKKKETKEKKDLMLPLRLGQCHVEKNIQ